MKKRSMDRCMGSSLHNLATIRGGYRFYKLHWWPWRPQKYRLHVLEKFKIENC